ncbi:MAG: neutral/alkaline ceramidase [Myxococcales bacterium]|jgi:neutral ceramidase|nr:neutral/alkaline ceramidase [Myxococcales bacterium]
MKKSTLLKTTLALLLILSFLLPGLSAFAQPTRASANFEIGLGQADITGPASGVGMMGYSMPHQKTGGLHTRLSARAFVIVSPETGERVAIVSADQLAVFQAVHQAVLKKLQARFGDRYTARNTLLSATHTHSGPGGTSHFAIYDLSILGFDPKGFEVVVDGIVEAIAQADANVRPANIRVGRGQLFDASINRSPQAQANNPRALLEELEEGGIDRQMTLLRFDAEDGTPLGVLDFFSVHATSMGNQNRLISSDNKGFAALGFERAMRIQRGASDFVAAFASSASGDVSPNILGGEDGGGADDFESTAISGQKQLDKALALYAAAEAGEAMAGHVDSRLLYVPMGALDVAPEFADGHARSTSPAAYGLSMIAGAEDGPGFGKEGQTCAKLPAPLRVALCRDPGQAEKPVLLRSSPNDSIPLTPSIVPVQLVRVGELAFVATPFEITTAAAHKLKKSVLDALASVGVRQVIVTGPSNGYASYLTTREEYAAQNYEGASTHFGPWTLGALQQSVVRLAEAMAQGEAIEQGTPPPDLSAEIEVELDHGDFDAAPLWQNFGDVLVDTADTFQPGDTARVRFVGASLNHRPIRPGGFLVVEREVNGRFEVIARDRDVETKLFWRRAACFPTFRCSEVTVEWRIPADAKAGSYRVRYLGTHRAKDTGALTDFEGVSRVFQIQRSDDDGERARPIALSAVE